jgi:hypothetical protein
MLMGQYLQFEGINLAASLIVGFLFSACLGYYNPIMSYGEEKAVQDAHDAGANGFIMVDLPPEEAIRFREICTSTGYGGFCHLL